MGIDVSVTAGPDGKSSSATVSGSIQHIITDQERNTFKLNDAQLKAAVNAYFGKAPNDAYLHSPTPWNDLYETYGWQQVSTVLVGTSADILGISSEPVIVKTQEFVNDSSKDGVFNVSISEEVSNTTTSTWSTGGVLEVGQTISYKINYEGAEAGGETSMSYSQSWGVGGEQSKTITVGSTSGTTVTLKPGEAVIAELSASRGTMKVKVNYNAYLIGYTAVNYNPAYKDHHFWALPIANVMSAGGISNSVPSNEVLDIAFYSNSKIIIRDKTSGANVATFYSNDMHPGKE